MTLKFLNSGRCSRTISRLELKPPVATTTVLLWISMASLPLASGDAGRRGHLCVSSLPALVDVMIVMLGIDSAVLINAVMKPKPLLSGRCQRSTRLPSWNFHVDPFDAAALGPVIEIVQAYARDNSAPRFRRPGRRPI